MADTLYHYIDDFKLASELLESSESARFGRQHRVEEVLTKFKDAVSQMNEVFAVLL
jgi:hypothetical protein